MVIEERYQVAKAKAKELCSDKEGLLKKILDFMNKVSESERLQSEAEENTKTIMERAETLEKELEEAKKMLAEKDVELKGYEAANDTKLQEAYYQG